VTDRWTDKDRQMDGNAVASTALAVRALQHAVKSEEEKISGEANYVNKQTI